MNDARKAPNAAIDVPPPESEREPQAEQGLLHALLDDSKTTARWTKATKAGYAIALKDDADGEGLRIFAPDGRMCLQIHLDPAGPRIEVHGAELHAHASDVVRLSGQRVEIEAEEALALRSKGTIEQSAAGNATSRAFEHLVEATHGEIHLLANDDVALDGERIRLNSAPQVRPPHLTHRRRASEGEG